jgi:hypothetical protein
MKYRCLIIPDAYAAFARELSAAVAGPAGDDMYNTPLSPTGAEPATHWISAGIISDEFAAMLPLTTYPLDAAPITTLGNPEAVTALANSAGYITTPESVQALFDASDVTEQEAHGAMARMGLLMIQPIVQHDDE